MKEFEQPGKLENIESTGELQKERDKSAAKELIRMAEQRLAKAEEQRAEELARIEGYSLSSKGKEDILIRVNKFWDDVLQRRTESEIEAREHLRSLEEEQE